MSNLKDKIIDWLDNYQVESYIIIEDVQYGYLIDVEGDVYLNNKKLTRIAVQFGRVSGDFYCGNNQLTILKGCPSSVGGFFACNSNNLTSLEGSPTSVGGSFDCRSNQLTSLLGGPHSVGSEFYCSDNTALADYQNIDDFAIIREKITSDNEKKALSNLLDKDKLTSSVLKL